MVAVYNAAMSKSTLAPLHEWLADSEKTLDAIGIFETIGWTAAVVACDQMAKAADIVVIQAEWNDMLGSVIKIAGSTSHVQSALDAGMRIANEMNDRSLSRMINRPDESAIKAIISPDEFNALIEQPVVKRPSHSLPDSQPGTEMSTSTNPNAGQALGFIETQGFTAVFEAIDTACKAASVEVVGKEKLGGGYVTVVIRGDVAAVNAAIEAAKPRIEGLGKLIACHVIARPSQAALGLLPK